MVTKKNIIGIVLIIFWAHSTHLATTISNKTRTIKPSQGTINLVLHVNNHQDAYANNSNTISSHQSSKSPTSDETPLLRALEKWLTTLPSIRETGSHFINDNKWYLMGMGLLGSYALISYIIISGNHFLNDQNLWSSWKQELSLEQLLSVPQTQCTQELIREIQRRYTDSSSISDIVKPLALFLNKIDQEEEQLRWYQSAYSWLSYTRLSKLVPMNQSRFFKISERLQRVAYYKNLFKSWAAEYQMQQAERMGHRSSENCYPALETITQRLQIETKYRLIAQWLKLILRLIPAQQ